MPMPMPRPLVLAAASLFLAFAATAKEPVFSTAQGAIRGFDPVAYHREGAPVKGSTEWTHEWSGATWRFSSPENLAAFRADPERYAPRYGGYCAWAVANGYTASTDPEAWAIVDERLYLNYSLGVQRRWRADAAGNIEKANANWPRVLDE